MRAGKRTQEGELYVTVDETERGVGITYVKGGISATTYAVLICRADIENFPHNEDSTIHLTTLNFNVDKDASSKGAVRSGIVTRIDDTSADVTWIKGVTFTSGGTLTIIRDRNFSPSSIKCSVVNGKLDKYLSNNITTNITAINSLTPLDTPAGAAIPSVGDLVVQYQYDSGAAYSTAISLLYHTERRRDI